MAKRNSRDRKRHDQCQGVTLIELMVGVVLLMVVALSSAKFFMTPAFLTEARRLAAVEKASGMMDCITSFSNQPPDVGYYAFDDSNGKFASTTSTNRLEIPILTNCPSIYYTFRIMTTNSMLASADADDMREVKLELFVDEWPDTSSFALFRLLFPKY